MKKGWLILVLLCFACGAEAASSATWFGSDRFSLMLGATLLHSGSDTEFLPALALRYRLDLPWLSAIEIGGATPTNVSSNLSQDSRNVFSGTVQSQVDSVREGHIAGIWEFWKKDWMIPEFALGLSVANFENQATENPPFDPYPFQEGHTTISQLTQLGVRFPCPHGKELGLENLSLHADAGYVHYSNHLNPPDGQDFNLGVSGLTFRMMLELQF